MNQILLIVFCAIFIFRGYFTNNFVCGTEDIITIPIKNTPRYIFFYQRKGVFTSRLLISFPRGVAYAWPDGFTGNVS